MIKKVSLMQNEVFAIAAGETVVFPGISFSVVLRRTEAIKRLEDQLLPNSIVFAAPTNELSDSLDPKLFPMMGATAFLRRTMVQSDGKLNIRLEGISRAVCAGMRGVLGCFAAQTEPVKESDAETVGGGLEPELQKKLDDLASNNPTVKAYLTDMSDDQMKPGAVADFLAVNLALPFEAQKKALETVNPDQRLADIFKII